MPCAHWQQVKGWAPGQGPALGGGLTTSCCLLGLPEELPGWAKKGSPSSCTAAHGHLCLPAVLWGQIQEAVDPPAEKASPLWQGSPTPGPWTATGPRPGRNWAARQEVSGGCEASSAAAHRSHYRLNHPLSPHPQSMEKSSSTKPVPGAKEVGGRCPEEWLEWTPSLRGLPPGQTSLQDLTLPVPQNTPKGPP